MSDEVWQLMRGWEGDAVVMRHDLPSDTWIFIALHDSRLGPCVGGTRLKAYERPALGLRDAQRLAEGMTYKWAAVDLPFGGGKAVLATPPKLDRSARLGLLQRYGRLLAELRGAFQTGVDLGTTPRDMARVGRETNYVMGVSADGEESMDPGPYTALGVFEGMRAALERAFDDPSPAGRTVLVQGVGDVGEPLARLLAEAGARLLLADVDEEGGRRLAEALGAESVPAEDALSTPCDVLAPCAVGGVLNRNSIPKLACRVVAGSANNQLEVEEDGERLRRRGILYAPDYIINAGGAIAFGRMHLGRPRTEGLEEEVRGIGQSLGLVFEEAERHGESPLHAARRRAEEVLQRAGDGA